jgi:hypothetical protein
MFKVLVAVALALPLAACVTTSAVSEEDMAHCRQMQAQMGAAEQHDHAEAKGQGTSAMNMTHARCRQMMHQS